MEKSDILHNLAQAVIDMDIVRASKAAAEAISCKIDPYEAITDGLARGMEKVNELFENEEYFVPEILLCADAMYAGIEVLRPYLPKETAWNKKKVVIGVVKGDTHDIGKNLVKIMLDNAGFEIHDLGRNIPYAKFVDTAGELNADLVCLSTLMTTTMDGMQVVIEDLKKAGIPSRVMVGGGPISPGFAGNIGADGYAKNAAEAVKVARGMFQGIQIPRTMKTPELVSVRKNREGAR
ncbi:MULTISPECIES: corrinoid protein [Candidatus Brocadia]|uniref:Cobalamin binding protein n=1 Tax=Candidatus Brocadia sinica JPN1 TaxID=1197129 RepID=A0ABQ0JWV4_9BACT|nr:MULTISPECIES: corrinoid protein [Brocadia]GAN33233.1 cobalamin binding protein [Candidatus Brocadia sinica JPN1]GIK13076.1 MAG: dimethylamine corrinoid protein [Candidatus Brocadia sinica]GJQ16675.1 MAG: dimethylamine corrinoid protein [Candidatus Brocadia sinica]